MVIRGGAHDSASKCRPFTIVHVDRVSVTIFLSIVSLSLLHSYALPFFFCLLYTFLSVYRLYLYLSTYLYLSQTLHPCIYTYLIIFISFNLSKPTFLSLNGYQGEGLMTVLPNVVLSLLYMCRV